MISRFRTGAPAEDSAKIIQSLLKPLSLAEGVKLVIAPGLVVKETVLWMIRLYRDILAADEQSKLDSIIESLSLESCSPARG